MMIDPVVIYLEKERSYIDVFERAGQIFLRGLTAENDGFVRQLEPPEAHALIEALEGFECMQAVSEVFSPPQHAETYREWYHWFVRDDCWYKPQVFNPDVNQAPVQLPFVDTAAQARTRAIMWIDKQYIADDNPASDPAALEPPPHAEVTP